VEDVRLSGGILAGIDGDRATRVDDDDSRGVMRLVRKLRALFLKRGAAQVR
jgi:hypothetical protein